jgi:hypothetical protein
MNIATDMDKQSQTSCIESTERELIEASIALGTIAESSGVYTHGLARLVAATGKPVAELAIGELLELNRQHLERFNRVHTELP